jgi:hypothetical protein
VPGPGSFGGRAPAYGGEAAGYGGEGAGYGGGAAGYGGEAAGYGGEAAGYRGPAEAGPGYDYSAPAAGFGTGEPGGPYGNGPAVGTMYGSDPAAAAGYPVGQENGTATREGAPPYPAQYSPRPSGSSPAQAAKARVTASLKAARRVKAAKPPRVKAAKRGARPGRQAQLTLARLEPWSVMKFSFVISLVAFIVLFVAVAVLYGVLSGLGVFTALQHTIQSITSSQSSSGFNIQNYLSASRVLGYTGLLGALNVVLITALSTVGAVLYNITADLAGGIEVTLKETD